ncbi:NADP-dependent isocitrate dehydrogenase [candidate division GN15 bacterium]|nr:NADP-dependent isocitrate dehydrogenase [candidate division GN15 bacterium]
MASRIPVTVAPGDGIGPEIMEATLKVLDAAKAPLDIERIEIGEKLYHEGHSAGIRPEDWESLRKTGLFLKGPITTPRGGGMKSLNVTVRKTLGLFANVRPVKSLAPFVTTKHPILDVIVIRENEEDLYAGIEHQQTDEVVQCLKLITRPGSEKIIRYAFEFARRRKRRKVTCMTKDNIMKLTDGLFHRVFAEISEEYPEIESEHLIVDIGMARMAAAPELFDILVVPNLYGDIVSDITAEISGSVGMGSSANIGDKAAMFEAIHGSAPTIAGKNIANPSGLLRSAVTMLVHTGNGTVAGTIYNAWQRAIEDGIHTVDIYTPMHSRKSVGTQEFADAVIERLGEEPQKLPPVRYEADRPNVIKYNRRSPAKKTLVGVDVFVHWTAGGADELAVMLQTADNERLKLQMISNRGVMVWPEGYPETFCTDHWRCRFYTTKDSQGLSTDDVIGLLGRVADQQLEFIKTEHLYLFDGEPGFSLGQGQ